MKKLLSFVLATVLMLSLAVPAFAGEYKEYPTIYVTGAQTNKIYDTEGNLVSNFNIDLEAVLEEKGMGLLKEFALGMLTDNYKQWASDFHDVVVDIYGKSALDKNGEASNGTAPEYHSSTVDVKEKSEGFGLWDYRFWYDWRISPMVTGNELAAYIDRVIGATGADKVNIVGRCYGANVIAAYVAMNEEHAAKYVDDISYFAPSIDGIDFMTALFTGEIYLDPDAVNNFADWYIENKDLIEDDALATLLMSLIELFNQVEVLGLGSDAIDLLLDRIKTDLLPPILRDTFASWTSYWAMVTPGNLEKAISFIFGGVEEEYSGLITKVRAYYDTVQKDHNETVLAMTDKGVRYNIFAKYNFPDYPLYKGAAVQGDGDTAIPRQTFGATAADYNKVLSEKYLSSVSEENQKYISPDHKIDASTCLLPENTWFIKNLHHDHWGAMEDMCLVIMNNDYNVSQQDVYPQFTDNNTGKEVTPDEDYEKPEENKLSSLFRFISAFLNFISKLFKGGFEFNFSFGA
ncbi:MAG: hypothetical protein IKY78_07020 [Clostridia bacterium]|nr:hypothetical protein [Clostridia bacterium]